MAEGWMRQRWGQEFEVFSAGILAKGIDPRAARVMQESGVDLSQHSSKTLASLGDEPFDYVVTVCGHADESCPTLPARTAKLHMPFDDPPKLTEGMGDDDALPIYRRVRDEIEASVASLPERLSSL